MKKLMVWVMTAMLILGTAVFASAESRMEYQSNFAYGTDGWYARSDGNASIFADMNALHINGRTSDWHSPGRDFGLVEGVTYTLSVQVHQDQAETAEFMISVAHTLDGAESYENLARGTAGRDTWVTLSGSYTAGHFDKFVLYVETVGAPALDFDMRFFRVQVSQDAPELMQEEYAAALTADGIPSLRETYADKFDFGAAIPQNVVTNGKIKEFVKSQFSIITPENELKPDSVLDVAASKKLAQDDETAVALRFDSARRVLDFAKEIGVKVHGHVLVWHSQTPETFFHEGYDVSKPLVGREVMLARMENYIKGVLEYTEENYPGLIVSWDVVNEAIDDGTNRLRESNWFKTVGEDFVNRAFEYARKYAPEGTLLYYNDYNTAVFGKLNGIAALLKSLIPEGNIDGYGFQMHHSVSSPTMEAIAKSIDTIGSLGLRLRVSEMDIGVDGNSEEDFKRQAQKYANVMKQLIKHSDQFEAVQVWGLTDSMSWRSANHPLLFDSQFQPKPAFWSVIDPFSPQ